jgi:hypothetical protein
MKLIDRCNSTIRTAGGALEAGTITSEQAAWFINQARALRGLLPFGRLEIMG